jgi:hypothetical protein
VDVKKGVSAPSHFCAQRSRSRGVRESANCCKRTGSLQLKKRIATLPKGDALGPEAIGKPVMLIEADPSGKGK